MLVEYHKRELLGLEHKLPEPFAEHALMDASRDAGLNQGAKWAIKPSFPPALVCGPPPKSTVP
jgi:hypothetical protein